MSAFKGVMNQDLHRENRSKLCAVLRSQGNSSHGPWCSLYIYIYNNYTLTIFRLRALKRRIIIKYDVHDTRKHEKLVRLSAQVLLYRIQCTRTNRTRKTPKESNHRFAINIEQMLSTCMSFSRNSRRAQGAYGRIEAFLAVSFEATTCSSGDPAKPNLRNGSTFGLDRFEAGRQGHRYMQSPQHPTNASPAAGTRVK